MQDEARNIWVWWFGASYIRDFTVFSFEKHGLDVNMCGYVMIFYVMLFYVMLGPWFEDFEPILKVQPLLGKTSWHWWNWHLVKGIYWSLVDCLHKGMSNFNIFFVVSLNMMLSKQSTRSNGLRTEMPGSSSYITVKPPNTSTKWCLYLRVTVKTT